MNISKRTLAVIHQAIIWRWFKGDLHFNLELAEALERIISEMDREKYKLSSSDEIRAALQQIGKPNKRKKRKRHNG